jgi:hypothetical protein
MSRGGTPQAISSESSAVRYFTASRNDNGLFIKLASVKAEPTSSFRLVTVTLIQTGKFLKPTEALNASQIIRCVRNHANERPMDMPKDSDRLASEP